MPVESAFHIGDIVIRTCQDDTRPCFELCSTSGEAQIRFDTWADAESAARAFAQAAQVDVWMGGREDLRLVAGFRTSARRASHATPTFDAKQPGGDRRASPA